MRRRGHGLAIGIAGAAPTRGPSGRTTHALLSMSVTALTAWTLAGPALSSARSTTHVQSPRASADRVMSVKDEGHLHLVKSSGSLLIDEGPATGTIPGKVKVRFVYDGDPTVTAKITIYGHDGTIQAHGSGKLSSPTSPSPSFKGTLTIDGGSGRYLHAHGAGRLYGVYYRRSYGMLVQTEGSLRY